MKVKCITQMRPNNMDLNYAALKVGKEYNVLSIEFYDSESSFSKSIGDFVLYRLRDNDGVVIPYPSNNFEITSNKLPSCWVSFKSDNTYEILPNTWARKYFWDDYYNDDERTLEEFLVAEKEILSLDE